MIDPKNAERAIETLRAAADNVLDLLACNCPIGEHTCPLCRLQDALAAAKRFQEGRPCPTPAERPVEKPWTLERELNERGVRAETKGKGGVEIHAGGYCLGVWVDHEYDGYSPRMARMLRRANHYDELRRVLEEFVTDVDAIGVNEVDDQWPDLVTTYHHAKHALAQEQGESHE